MCQIHWAKFNDWIFVKEKVLKDFPKVLFDNPNIYLLWSWKAGDHVCDPVFLLFKTFAQYAFFEEMLVSFS